jgi:hypothetical protein
LPHNVAYLVAVSEWLVCSFYLLIESLVFFCFDTPHFLVCRVVDAVKDATSSKAFGKRKVEELEPELPVKRVRMFGILEEEEEDSEDEDAGATDAGVGVGPSIGASKSDQAAEDLPSAANAEPVDMLEPGTSGAPAEGQQSTGMTSNAQAAKEYGQPLDLSKISAAQELEVLGLDRLKEELQERGLKCGGSLGERAARLFLLKSIPLEKLDKKLFAKPRQERRECRF